MKIILRKILDLCDESESVAVYVDDWVTSSAACLSAALADKILEQEVVSIEGDTEHPGRLKVWIG